MKDITEREAVVAGDRVCLIESDNWVQPMRGWAKSAKPGTVEKVYTPMGAKDLRASVRFDHTRDKGPAGVYHFNACDLRHLPKEQNDG